METATTTSAATTIDSAVCSSIVPLKYGDQVVLYESVHSMKLITLVEGQQYSNKFGSFGHFEFIGRTYGEKVTRKTYNFLSLHFNQTRSSTTRSLLSSTCCDPTQSC